MKFEKVKSLFWLIIIGGLLATACGMNKVDYGELIGGWKIISAERNGKTTQTLDNVYFEFSKAQQMKTNLLGQEDLLDIKYSFPTIEIQSSTLSKFNVRKLEEDTLFLSTRINDYRYDFYLLRADSE